MKYKALAIFALAAASAMPVVKAQNLMFDNPDNRTYFGARVAVDISSAANGGAYYSNKAGFAVGAVYNMPIWKNLYFEPGLSLFYDTFGTVTFDNEKNPDYNIVPNAPEYISTQVDGSIRNLGFRIPLNFGFHFDFAENLSLKVFTGPQLNVSFMARYHQNEYQEPVSGDYVLSVSESIFGTKGFKHCDAQWNFGLGLDYDRYYVAVSGSVGMTKMCDSEGLFEGNPHKSIRRNLMSITVGYNF